MTTISPITVQPISRATLQDLLSCNGQVHENLGAGVNEATICLQDAMAFYDLPAVLSEPLSRFRLHLDQALVALADARQLLD